MKNDEYTVRGQLLGAADGIAAWGKEGHLGPDIEVPATLVTVLQRAHQMIGPTAEFEPGLRSVAALAALEMVVQDQIHTEVQHARLLGFTWAQIGTATGISRQGAQQRWGS